MPSTLALRRRIRSVKNTAQITKAMELVAASRMRRAQQNVQSARPFSQKVLEVIADIAALQKSEEIKSISPLLQQRPVQRVGLVFVTADRGLAGALNTNAIRRAVRFITEEADGKPVQVVAVGRKGRDFMIRSGKEIVAEFIGLPPFPSLLDTLPISKVVIDDYVNGKYDAVYLLYTDFVNTLTVRPKLIKLLPIDPNAIEKDKDTVETERTDFIFEPNPNEVLRSLLPRYVEVEIYQAILENIASEQSSKMVAMRNASDKAKEVVTDLTLTMNKVRQASITNEILEISNAAAALESQG
ncbi:MAG: synthase gamma chain [Chloroflexi bacterium]|jgi:F-type H+-transporting ATPase subunit gamma|nr:synthase gamma chain [Chloroflexota bacterium]